MRTKVGQTIDLRTNKRYVQLAASYAISDIYDALVELITNSDDSYHNLYREGKRAQDGGDILIEHEERRKRTHSLIVVRDRAEGMDSEVMERALATIGEFSDQRGSRGYLGRGAKDCTALGDLTYESIVDERYYRAMITHTLEYTLEVDEQRATDKIRDALGIPHGNGTLVTLHLRQNRSLPRLSTLQDNLPQHFALRGILAEDSDTRVLLRRKGNRHGDRPKRLVYRPPIGELVVDEVYPVPGYDGASAALRIWRTAELIPDSQNGRRFDQFGLLVQSERAIHENCIPAESLRREHGIQRYFGIIQCHFIDDLLREYETAREARREHPSTNPSLLIDPGRKGGLEREHPFTRALLSHPAERLRELLLEEKRTAREQRREIIDSETQAYLERLGKLVGRFMQQRLEDSDFSDEDAVDKDSYVKKGIVLLPTYATILVGKQRKMTVYARKELFDGEAAVVEVETDAYKAVRISSKRISLDQREESESEMVGTFKVKGVQPKEVVLITVKTPSGVKAEALVRVVTMDQQEHEFSDSFEFKHKVHTVQVGRRRSLNLYAKIPEVVRSRELVKVRTTGKGFVLKGQCHLSPEDGKGFAVGTILVEGRSLNGKGTVIAEIGGHTAKTQVKVVERMQPGSPIRIHPVDEDFVGFRARWADKEGRPNELLVAARDKAIARYIGPAERGWPGQRSPLFRAVLAEIVAESTCRRVLERDAEQRPWQFGWADLGKDHLIAGDVIVRLQRLLRDFLADAHALAVTTAEITNTWEESQ